jgi:hypothetical protein
MRFSPRIAQKPKEKGTLKGLKPLLLGSLTLALLSTSGAASAYMMTYDQGGYFELNLGESRAHNKTYLGSLDNIGYGYSINGGYMFNRNVALEAGYTRYRDVTIENAIGDKVANDRLYSIHLAGKATFPIDYDINLFAKLGIARATSTVSIEDAASASALGQTATRGSDLNLYFGIGADRLITNNFFVNIQWNRARGGSKTGTLDLVSLGVTWML